MNRGSSSHSITTKVHACSFNEAPIHESGKCADPDSQSAMLNSFNEAPIHESGKYLRETAMTVRDALASMRPRFMNRGSSLPIGAE